MNRNEKPAIIHIHRGRIDGNRKHGRREPPIIVRRGTKREAYGNIVELGNPPHTRIVYSPDKPLDCGARVWIETTEQIHVLEPANDSSPTEAVCAVGAAETGGPSGPPVGRVLACPAVL